MEVDNESQHMEVDNEEGSTICVYKSMLYGGLCISFVA